MLGVAGGAQADTYVNTGYAAGANQAERLLKISRILLGYDQFGHPVYGHQRLPRQIIDYYRFGRPVYSAVYNNQPLAPSFGIFNDIVRPHYRGWNWGNRHWA